MRGVRLGKGHLALTPADGRARSVRRASPFTVSCFDRFDVDVDAALLPKGPSVHGRVAFRRLEIHALAPELVALGDGRSVASGRVAVDLDPGQPLALDVLLPELWLSIARAVDGPNGETTMQRVRIEAARPVHLHVAGDHIALDEAHFATDGGDLRVEGAARRARDLRRRSPATSISSSCSRSWAPSPSIDWAAICAPS